MKKRLILYIVFVLAFRPLIAQNKDSLEAERMSCIRIKTLCSAVSNRVKDGSGQHKWLYQRFVYEAARIKDSDTEAEIIRKIHDTWIRCEPQLYCTDAQFDVSKGNFVKWAVSYQHCLLYLSSSIFCYTRG